MTRTGCICMIAVMALAAFGILFGRVRGKDKPLRPSGTSPCRGGRELPTVIGEPVVFRTADLRFVTCKSSMEVGREQAEALGFDPRRETERAQARRYWEKELAYRLADLLLEQGGIRFQLEGNIYRAELKAVLPERSGT
ncbi:MAG: hypothetical protein IKO00_07510 [Oscillospiraceae bacterium]|nr:hypothetical protein [Oscillospiraceae bacterium]